MKTLRAWTPPLERSKATVVFHTVFNLSNRPNFENTQALLSNGVCNYDKFQGECLNVMYVIIVWSVT